MLHVFVLLLVAAVHGSDVTRDFFGDIFRMRDCHNGSRCDDGGSRPAMEIPGRPCYCQCAPTHLAYREDKQQCVKDIRECYMSVFYRPFTVEAIPLVYLPTSGQLVHPDAHLSLAGRKSTEGGGFPTCKAAVSQYLTRDGWRTLTRVDGGGPVFGLFEDANKTFLQFLGNSQDRRILQQHLAMVRLFCRIPKYSPFETCVAIRVGWVPGVDSVEDGVPSSKANMMVVGLSLGVLGLVYVFAVVVYLKIRRQQIAKRKGKADREACIQAREEEDDNAPGRSSIEASKRLELYHTSTLGRSSSSDPWSQMSSLVETYNRTWTDRMGQPGCEFRAQDFQIQPEFFEPEFMASPPQQVLEYLERLQSSVTFARHRLRSCYRYQPTLIGIPEDDYFYQELEKVSPNQEKRTTPDGGSASSMASLLEIAEDQEDVLKKDVPKIPPRKPKRKSLAKTKVEINHEALKSSEQEQKEIQNAMNTLNETLDALEYDIYKHDLMHHISDTEQTTRPNSTEVDLEEFDTSSCSSLSAVTVLGKEVKKHSDINSTGSRSVEKNLSEDFSTFRNSTFSVGHVMPGLFARRNIRGKASNQSECSDNSSQSEESEKSDRSSRSNSVENPPSKSNIGASVQTTSDNNEKVLTKQPKQCHSIKSPVPSDDYGKDSKVKSKRNKLCKSSSTESMTTISTDMTTDSLDSRSSSPNPQRISLSPTPSLVDMWINKLIQNSAPSSKSRRKSKKKLVLPESEADGWEHVCQKQHQPKDASCPMHDLNSAEPNLIDKLAHYSSKTMAGQNVAGYFQSLKQDVLKEHLKTWLISNSQIKRHRNGITVKYRNKEYSHKKPLVSNGLDPSSSESANTTWKTFNTNLNGATEKDSKIHDSIEPVSFVSVSEMIDSLESQNCAKIPNGEAKAKSNKHNLI